MKILFVALMALIMLSSCRKASNAIDEVVMTDKMKEDSVALDKSIMMGDFIFVSKKNDTIAVPEKSHIKLDSLTK